MQCPHYNRYKLTHSLYNIWLSVRCLNSVLKQHQYLQLDLTFFVAGPEVIELVQWGQRSGAINSALPCPIVLKDLLLKNVSSHYSGTHRKACQIQEIFVALQMDRLF